MDSGRAVDFAGVPALGCGTLRFVLDQAGAELWFRPSAPRGRVRY